jgi:hypothetical protein
MENEWEMMKDDLEIMEDGLEIMEEDHKCQNGSNLEPS